MMTQEKIEERRRLVRKLDYLLYEAKNPACRTRFVHEPDRFYGRVGISYDVCENNKRLLSELVKEALLREDFLLPKRHLNLAIRFFEGLPGKLNFSRFLIKAYTLVDRKKEAEELTDYERKEEIRRDAEHESAVRCIDYMTRSTQ